MARARRSLWIRGALGVFALLVSSAFFYASADEEAASPFSRARTSGAITLKSGQTIDGIRVVGLTTIDYVVEVYEGVYIRLPRGQVVSVEPEAWNNTGHDRPRDTSEPSVLLPGRRISPQLNARLNRGIVEEPVEYEHADFLEVLEDIEQYTGASFEIAPEVEQLPEEDRQWSFTMEPGDTLLTVLRERFASAFPEVEVEYGYNHIHVTLASVEAEENEEPSPPSSAEEPGPSDNESDQQPASDAPFREEWRSPSTANSSRSGN